MANGNSDVKLVPGQVKVEAWDLCVDSQDRRKNATPHRRALVHDYNDGLTVNWGNDYPNGVTLKGVRTIEGQNLGPITKTEFKNVLDFHGALECFSQMRFIANPSTWTQISHDSGQRLVFESKFLGKPKDIVFKSPVLTHQVSQNGPLHVVLVVKPGGGIARPPADVTDQQFDAVPGASAEQLLAIAGQTEQEALVKVDAVDAIATLAQTVGKLQASVAKIAQLSQELAALKAQLAAVQDNWRWCNKCQGLWFAGSPPTKKKPCPAGGEHSQDGSGNYRLLK
jgi:hypothetical protein